MNKIKEQKIEQLLESLSELEQLIKEKVSTVALQPPDALEKKVLELEERLQSISKKNQKVYEILEKVIDELEKLLTNEENKCQQ